ncbi:MAG: outer membrane beta-barrel protein [Flavobacteriaceae bacterium]|nr:outer membrane beta-barrel protein [Flavobacteriaceae bacterium]
MMNPSNLFKIFLFLIFLLPVNNWSQNIKGKVVDHENNPIEFASVAIINPKDSILISYTSTDKQGAFKLTEISNGERIFQVHFVGFKTYQSPINFQGETINMGTITLENDSNLDEVVVTLVTPVSIKKDTVTYNTKAFKVRIDDTVEDLLKKLPGIEVDVSGKITAQGEEVTKIYVDGKEFFSGDPAIASKNLSADAVKRIEVIDEKSEKARITGINDSERKKVINLELKDNKKVNDFGKFQGGYGTDDRFLTGMNYNRFTPKFQASILGKYNNVNSSGSDISDIMIISTGGRMSSGGPPGFLTTGIIGLNLGYELKEDQNVNTDYFFNHTNVTSGDIFINRTEFIEDLEINSENKSSNENISNNHSLNFSYRDQSNKLSSFYINGSIYYNNNHGNSINTLDKYNGENELDLQSIGKTDSESNNNSGNVSIQYTKRFNEKSKRNFSVSGNFDTSKNNNFSNNNQINRFNIADPDKTYETIEEVKRDQKLQNLNLGLNLNYIEPLAKYHFLEIKGNIKYVSSDDDVNQSKYEDNIIQNPLIYDQYYINTDMTGGVFYKYDKEKFTFNIGGLIADQTQKFGLENQEEYNNRYKNFNSEMSLRYRPKRGKFINFNLRKSVRLPSWSQLTPVVNDFNSLFISHGNPNLTPENNYSASTMFINHNFTKGYNFLLRLSYRHTSNSIINSEFTNELGIRTTSYENSGNKNRVNASIKLGKRVKSLGLRYNISLNGGYNEYLSIINTKINETQSKNGTLDLSLENNKKEKIDAIIGASWNKNYTTFSSGNNADRKYLQQSYYTKMDWNITDRLNLNSQFKFDIYTDSNFESDQSVPIWNASISYTFLKSKSMNIMITALDILNKNIGVIRTSSDNYFEEIHQEVLGNYYLLSLTYNLKGNKN